MTTTGQVILTIIVAVISAAMAFILVKLFDRLRRRDALSEAADIIAKANQEGENRRREGEPNSRS